MLEWFSMLRITLQGVFTAANKYIALNRYNRYLGGKIKNEETDRVFKEVLTLSKGREPISTPRDFKFIWFMPDRRKDPDNISFGIKYIMDGLVHARLLKDDNWAVVHTIKHEFQIDPSNPRVQIYLKEVHEPWD